MTCLSCLGNQDDVPPTLVEEVDIGVAGASARREGEARHARQLARREALVARRPLVGRLQVAMAGPATEGLEWIKGATGEERVGAVLASLADQGVLVLHDRCVPKSKANIDHIAVTPNGIWVIDPKCYSGKVEERNRGGWFRPDWRLYVNGRDRSSLVKAMHRQRVHVVNAIAGTDYEGTPVRAALCFVDGAWPLFQRKPLIVDGIVVSWPKKLWPMLSDTTAFNNELDADKRAALHRHLAKALPSKR